MRGHDLDPVSLVFGAALALLGLAFLLLRVDAASVHLERVWPVVVMAVGLLIVAVSVGRSRGRGEPVPAPAEPAQPAEAGDEPDGDPG